MRISKHRCPEFQLKVESIVYLVAEWVSVKEMKAFQSVCMLVSMKAREKEYEEFLSDMDNQVREEWQKYLMGKEESLAVIRRCANSEAEIIAAHT